MPFPIQTWCHFNDCLPPANVADNSITPRKTITDCKDNIFFVLLLSLLKFSLSLVLFHCFTNPICYSQINKFTIWHIVAVMEELMIWEGQKVLRTSLSHNETACHYVGQPGLWLSVTEEIRGAPGMIWTCDTWIRNPVLYPLSYEGNMGKCILQLRDL